MLVGGGKLRYPDGMVFRTQRFQEDRTNNRCRDLGLDCWMEGGFGSICFLGGYLNLSREGNRKKELSTSNNATGSCVSHLLSIAENRAQAQMMRSHADLPTAVRLKHGRSHASSPTFRKYAKHEVAF